MRRREFTLLVGGAAMWPLVARAQQPAKIPIVGFIVPGTEQSHGKWVAAFTARLAELGWIDGRTVVLAYRWAAGHTERYPEMAAELARLGADVVATSVPGGVAAMKQAAPQTPIVMTALSSGSSYIESLSHPGGMVTGMSQLGEELGRKRLELLAQVVPRLRHLAVLGIAADLKRVPETALVTSAGQQYGIEITPLVIRQAEEIAPTIASIEGRVEALYVIIDPLISVNQAQINMLALKAGLPTMHGLPDYVRSGGLMSYGASFEDLFAGAADYVDKILRGAKPGDLPVAQPTKFHLVINMKTATALGLTVPYTLLAAADELIE
jgi:putative ABC transport system substrate-binding protein